jgi:hypothetical protein
VVVVVVFLTYNNNTPTKVVLSCFWLLLGLWQLVLTKVQLGFSMPLFLLSLFVVTAQLQPKNDVGMTP